MGVIKRYIYRKDNSNLSEQQGKDLTEKNQQIIRGAALSEAPVKLVTLKKITPKIKPAVPKPSKPKESTPKATAAPSNNIKANTPDSQNSAPAPASHDRKKIEEEIRNYKSTAEAEIKALQKKMIAEAEARTKEIEDEAYQEGLKKGQEEGLLTYQEKAQELLQTISSLAGEKSKILKKSRVEILRLAMKIAEQILKSEISLNQAVCVNIVAEAISKITDKDKVIIRVNSADADFVRLNKDRIMSHMSDIKNLTIQDDNRIEQGGCIIETNLGYIDSKISTKLESIEKAIYKVFDEEQQEESLQENTLPPENHEETN